MVDESPILKSVETRKRKNSQDRIFRSAVSVLAKKGYHNTRITDIAQHAGVAYGLVYHYFGSKQNILDVILDEVALRFNERLDRIAGEVVSLNEKLGRISDYMFDSYLANEEMSQLLVNEVVHGPGSKRSTEIAAGLISRISGMIQVAVSEKQRIVGSINQQLEPQVIALSFFGSVQMLLSALVADYYDRNGQTKGPLIKGLKQQLRLMIEKGHYGRF
ncbi:MAG: TetR/AcrR family transcriptional regulator [Leptonema sp. (in: Bacteria)]|nr:TetR/AcrR family transcriptional regulator [Leptonema sp. (in: bacteria)]